MIIYNVTIKVATPIQDAWLQWLKEEHVPEVVGTGCFTHAVITKLLEIDDSEGPTYLDKHANEMRLKSFDKWGNQFIAFRSVMQIVN